MKFPRILLVSVLLLSPYLATAQSTSASLTGLVDDPAKALIPGATITAINTQTGEKASTTTNKEGQYVLPGLNPGTYRIEVDKPGFKGIIEAGLTLHVQDAVQINFHMAVGSSSESVTVTADQINMNTQDGTVSTVIDQSYIANMPLNGRSFQDLILLTPGVVTNSPQASQTTGSGIGQTGEFSVNGQRTEDNYYSVDGVSANFGTGTASNVLGFGAGPSGSLGPSTALGTTQGLTSVDSLQEFRVQSSTYSAEYGRNPGGQFSFETKSGTDKLHGSLFEYLRNGDLDAADWFNGYFGIPYPSIHQNDFGGTVGGPVSFSKHLKKENKTFFFASYEGLRLISPQAASINFVPDLSVRTSAAPAIQPPLNSFSLPNGPDLGGGIGEFIGSWSNPSAIDAGSIRFDQNVTDKMKLFFRFDETVSDAETRPTDANGSDNNAANPSNPETDTFTIRTYTLGANNTIKTRLQNDLRLNYSTDNVSSSAVTDGFAGATPVNFLQAAGLKGDISTAVFAATLGSYGIATQEDNQLSSQTQWNVIDTLVRDFGHHELKFGIDARRLTPSIQFDTEEAAWEFSTEAQVLGNDPALVLSVAILPHFPLYQNLSVYAQDEWRASQRLNLSIGVRWDVNPAPSVTKGTKPYTLTGLNDPNTATLAPYGTPLWQTSWTNFAPRIGAAYRFRDSTKNQTVLRGGWGLFYDTGQQTGSAALAGGPGSSAVAFNTMGGAYPQIPPIPVVVTNPPSGNFNAYGYAPHLELPYTQEWNISVQQAIGEAQSLTLSYVGSHASRLLQSNFIQPTDNPSLGFYYYIENGGSSDYNSMQAQFQRRLSAGLTGIASYTWSHCFDDGSSNIAIGYQRGNCDFDVRNNFSGAVSYTPPPIGHNTFVGGIVNHWGADSRFTARTGFPVTLAGQQLLYPNGQLYDAGLDVVPGQPIYLYGANCASTLLGLGDLQAGQTCPGGRAINPNAFNLANSGLGDAPRNFVRGFGALQLDTAIRREFPLTEQLKLQFRAEAFNVLNHPNFGSINGGYGQVNFGQATATLANSLGVLSPLYQMGGPRSMQFSLRLAF
jgi:Carboxypeptidase regulatory-like domain/TonB dependent receptor